MREWENRFTDDNWRIAERYLKSQIVVCVHYIASGGAADSAKFCAVFQHLGGIERHIPASRAAGHANFQMPPISSRSNCRTKRSGTCTNLWPKSS